MREIKLENHWEYVINDSLAGIRITFITFNYFEKWERIKITVNGKTGIYLVENVEKNRFGLNWGYYITAVRITTILTATNPNSGWIKEVVAKSWDNILERTPKLSFRKYKTDHNGFIILDKDVIWNEIELPKKVLFNEETRKTTLLYKSEKETQKYRSVSVTAVEGDTYDKEKGFLIAFFQETTGMSKTAYKKYINKILKGERK